jgi:Polysaccharide lyase
MALNPRITDQGNKLKMTWTPDLSGQGYRFYVDGVAVSRTFKADASSTEFEKKQGSHKYGIQKMDVVPPLEEIVFPTPDPGPINPPIWNGDWETGNRSQYGGVEFGGTFGAPPTLDQRVQIIKSDGAISPLQGEYMAKIIVAPGDRYGKPPNFASGERTLLRQYEPMRFRGSGYETWLVFGVYFPTGGYSDGWVFLQWHQPSGAGSKPFEFNPQPNSIRVDIGQGPPGSWNQLQNTILPTVRKDCWHVFVTHHLFHQTDGITKVWHGIEGEDSEPELLLDLQGIQTLKGPPDDSASLLMGWYREAASHTNVIVHDGAREYPDEASALAWAKTLLG